MSRWLRLALQTAFGLALLWLWLRVLRLRTLGRRLAVLLGRYKLGLPRLGSAVHRHSWLPGCLALLVLLLPLVLQTAGSVIGMLRGQPGTVLREYLHNAPATLGQVALSAVFTISACPYDVDQTWCTADSSVSARPRRCSSPGSRSWR